MVRGSNRVVVVWVMAAMITYRFNCGLLDEGALVLTDSNTITSVLQWWRSNKGGEIKSGRRRRSGRRESAGDCGKPHPLYSARIGMRWVTWRTTDENE